MVPEIAPVLGSMERPLGSPVAVKVRGTPIGSAKLAPTGSATGAPSLTVASSMGVAVGGTLATVQVKVSGVTPPLPSSA